MGELITYNYFMVSVSSLQVAMLNIVSVEGVNSIVIIFFVLSQVVMLNLVSVEG